MRRAFTMLLPWRVPVLPAPIIAVEAWICVYHSHTEEGDPLVQVIGPHDTLLLFGGWH